MADVIGFPNAARVRELEGLLEALRGENARLIGELAESRGDAARAQALYDLVRLQMNDILATVAAWKGALETVEGNILKLKTRLP